MSVANGFVPRTRAVEVLIGAEVMARSTAPERLRADVERALKGFVTGLSGDLGLSTPLGLDVRTSIAVRNPPGFELIVCGERVQPAQPGGIPPDAGAREIARGIGQGLFEARALMLKAEVGRLQRVWGHRLPAPALAAEKPRVVGELFAMLARHCFSVHRALDADAPPGPDRSARAWFEHAVASADCLALTVYLPPGPTAIVQPGSPSLGEALAALGERLLEELGVYLPPVRVEVDRGLAPGETRFRLNDVRTPPVEAEAEAALEAAIRPLAAAFLTLETIEFALDRLAEAFPVLVDELPSFERVALARTLRDLLDKGRSIRGLRPILDDLATTRTVFLDDTDHRDVFPPPTLQVIPGGPSPGNGQARAVRRAPGRGQHEAGSDDATRP